MHRPAAWIAPALALLAALAIGPGLLPGRTPLPLDILALFAPWKGEQPPPANPLVGDAVLQFSSRIVAAEALRGGHFPLWDPTVMAGHPHDGDTHASPFDPLQLIPELLFSAQRAYALQLLLQLWIAGLGMYLWLRRLALGRFAALFGAVTWMLAGYQQVFVSFAPFAGTLAWMPWVAAAWEHAVGAASERARRGAVAGGGLAVGLAIVAGQVQFVLYLSMLLALYGLARVRSLHPDARRRGVLAGIGIVALGLALGAVHLLPSVAVAADSIRPPFTLAALRRTAVPLSHLVTAIVPWFMGDPRRGDYRGAQNASELMLYIGLAPLLLVLAAAYVRRDALTRLFGALALLTALIALGSPVAWVLAWVPWLQRFGLMRWLAAWPFVAAPLAALALDAAVGSPDAARRLVRAVWSLTVLLAVVALMAAGRDGFWHDADGRADVARAVGLLTASAAALVAWAARPAARGRSGTLLAVVAADLLLLGWGYTPSAPVAAAYPLSPPLDRLAAERRIEPFRVAVFQGESIALGPAVAPAVGLDEIGGYSSSVRNSYRRFLAGLTEPTDNAYLPTNPNIVTLGAASPVLLRLLNVRYVLSAAPLRPFERPLDADVACTTTHDLGDGVPIGADVVPWSDGLNRIDVAVASGGAVAVHVRASAGAAEHLAYGALPRVEGRVRSLYFEPMPASAGHRLHVSVDRPAGAADAAPVVCVAADGGERVRLAVGYGTTQPPYRPAFEANGLFVSRVERPMGRAWLVPMAVVASGQDRAIELLASGAVDSERAVGVELPGGGEDAPGDAAVDGLREAADADEAADDAAEDAAAGAGESADPADPADPADAAETRPARPVAVTDDGPNVRRVVLPAGAGGWLVLSEAWAPGWRARVDGRPAAVRRAFGGLQAVAVADGSRHVVLRYRPLPVVWGAVITLAALATAALLLLARGRPRRSLAL